ncbi:DUF2637 domain-containing protein, partial [Streptomyces tendae]|uniref:DUF2637 domain-containing protein n=1 Tax=Streptomyces tendae TaxID=1932 RepID=UPI003719539B
GRIADITADKHMEGVRLTRWLLSPVPTFLLWRRMKLWELRSYEQVIKLEQERLVYRARLRSRFGRAWRRKAPVESLMPLRLARYGVPLAQTGPSGLAAAGVDPTLLPLVPEPKPFPVETLADRERDVAEHDEAPSQPQPQPSPRSQHELVDIPTMPLDSQGSNEMTVERFAVPYQEFINQFQVEPTAAQWAFWLGERYGLSSGAGDPLSEAQVQPLLQVLQGRYGRPVEANVDVEEPSPADDLVAWPDDALIEDTTADGDRQAVHASGAESGARGVVQMRLRPSMKEKADDAEVPADGDGSGTGMEPETEQEDGSHLTGPARVEFHYRKLSPEEQERSAKSLAPLLAERCGYAEGTVRKYLGTIKRGVGV